MYTRIDFPGEYYMNSEQNTNERVKKLAETLRSNGLAASDTQALEMAKNMVQTDDKVMEQADRNKSSMIHNYDINKPAAAVEDPFAQKREPVARQPAQSQPWEKEETAQDNPAPKQGPAPSSNQALDEAISTVQEQFKQPVQNNPELPQDTLLQEATREQPPVETPVEQPIVEPEPIVEPTPAPASEPQAPTPEPATPEMAAEPTPAPTVVENPLPAEEPSAPITPVETPVAQPAPPVVEQAPPAPAEDLQPERTQEVPTAPAAPERDNSHMAESKIKLADVFNVNK